MLSLLALLLGNPALAAAQTTVLRGRVTGPDGVPASGARIQVTSESGAAVETVASPGGLYRVAVPESPSYAVAFQAPGLSPATRIVRRNSSGSELVLDIALELRVVALQPVTVTAERLSVEGATRWVPGTSEQSRSGLTLRDEPLTDFLSDIVDRRVGVAQSGDGISIGGQAPEQTRLTLDGSPGEGAMVPREAVRTVNILSNTYDVARGQFTGGQVDVRTQQAGNEWSGAIRLDRRDPHLQYGDAPRGLRGRASSLAVDGGGGGAIVRDRLFVYGALSSRASDVDAVSLLELSPGRLQRVGISPGSVDRLREGTARWHPEAGEPGRQTSHLTTALVRLDAPLSSRHSLTVRFDGQAADSRDRASLWSVAGTGENRSRSRFGTLGQLSSGEGRLANDLRVYFSTETQNSDPMDPVPGGIVSLVSDSASSYTAAGFRFAGSLSSPSRLRRRNLEMSDEFVLLTADENHRLRAGVQIGIDERREWIGPSSGLFEFSRPEDVERGIATRFTRRLDAVDNDLAAGRAAVFADDHWNRGRFQLSYGLRAERAWYSGAGESNPLIEARFGRSPGRIDSEWRVSPRVGFAYQLPGGLQIQGGAGEFLGALPLAQIGGALAETGVDRQATLLCAGPATPVPDWEAYRRDAGTVPSSCADGAPSYASLTPSATTFAPDFSAPRLWRASVNSQGVLWKDLIWSTAASAAWGTGQAVAFDRNLRTDPAFRNPHENGRPVFVAAEDIDPSTGIAAFGSSRRFPDLGTVREITGQGESRTIQVAASMSKLLSRISVLGSGSSRIGYTWTHSRETVSPVHTITGRAPSTGSNPFQLEWAAAEYMPVHMVYASASFQSTKWVTFDLRGRLASGTPFTPMVDQDVNGDGLANDRAFVFDPAVVQNVELSREMEQLLANSPRGVRACLRSQLGRIAAPKSCRTGWSSSVDLSARVQFGRRIADSHHRRATLYLFAGNLGAGLDYLLNGPNGLRGWGQPSAVEERLLSVRGFSADERGFRYTVNPRFGSSTGNRLLARSPLTLSVQVRVVLGTDRPLALYIAERNSAADAVAAFAPGNLRAHALQQLPNLPAEVLLRNGPSRLYLQPDQVARLQQSADSLSGAINQLSEQWVQAVLAARAGGQMDLRDFRALAGEVLSLRTAGLELSRAVLSPEQWARLPRRLRRIDQRIAPFPVTELSGGGGG